jgi:hypothetical protein
MQVLLVAARYLVWARRSEAAAPLGDRRDSQHDKPA